MNESVELIGAGICACFMKKKRCDHYWCYENAIWSAGKYDSSKVAVGRYCANCGLMQTAVAKDWWPVPKSYVDMRETMEASMAN